MSQNDTPVNIQPGECTKVHFMDLFFKKKALKKPSEMMSRALSNSTVSHYVPIPFSVITVSKAIISSGRFSQPFSFLTASHHTGNFFTSCSIFVLPHLDTSLLSLTLILVTTLFNQIKTPLRGKHVEDKTETCLPTENAKHPDPGVLFISGAWCRKQPPLTWIPVHFAARRSP